MSRIRSLAACCLYVLFGSVVAAADPVVTAGPDFAAPGRVARAAEQKLLKSLHKKIKAEWTGEPVEEVLTSLATSAGVNLWINRQALSDEGISLDVPVNLDLGEATVWQTLHFLLPPLGLSWVAADGVLEIMTAADADKTFVTRSYDVSAITHTLDTQWKTVKVQPRQPRPYGYGPLGGGGFFDVREDSDVAWASRALPILHAQFSEVCAGGMWHEPGVGATGYLVGGPQNAPVGTRLDQMIQTFGEASWHAFDGGGGAIHFSCGRLVVGQTYQAQFRVQALLQAVEAFVVRGAKAKTILVARPGYPHDEDAGILQWLSKPRDIKVRDVPWEQALESLTREARIRLWVDRQALTGDGISLDAPVSLSLNGVTLDAGLRKLLHPLGLTFVIEEGTLIVTTRSRAANEMFQTVLYNGTDVFEPADFDGIMNIIQECTSGMWEQTDGEGGSMSPVSPRVLAVRQPQAVHAEIAALFDELREPAAVAPVASAPEFETRLYPVTDATAIDHLLATLPKFIPTWDVKEGSIHRLGESLLIKQPALVQDRLSELFSALNQAHRVLHPPKPVPTPTQPPAPTKPAEPKPAGIPAQPETK